MSRAHPTPRPEHVIRLAAGGTIHVRPSEWRRRRWAFVNAVYRNRDLIAFVAVGLSIIAGLWFLGDPSHQHVASSARP